DGSAGHAGAVLAHPDLGRETVRGLDEQRGGAGMESALVADFGRPPRGGPGVRRIGRARTLGGYAGSLGAHRCASASSCEATLMYLRPASCAPSTARSRLSVWR